MKKLNIIGVSLDFIFSVFVNILLLISGAALYIVSMAEQGHPLPLVVSSPLVVSVALIVTIAQYVGRAVHAVAERNHEKRQSLPVSDHPGL